MGRPKLYHTPEEKRQANRAKSKRHYDKAKKVIRARRSVKGRENARRTFKMYPRTHAEEVPLSTPKGDALALKLDNLDTWCRLAERVDSKFSALIGISPFHYIDNLYHRYLVSLDYNTFRDEIILVSQLQKSIRRYEDAILQIAGVGTQLKRCEEIGLQISDVIKALEDILCVAMADELVASHSRKLLVYLSLPCS